MEQHGIKMKFYQVFKQNKTKIVTSKNPSKKILLFIQGFCGIYDQPKQH